MLAQTGGDSQIVRPVALLALGRRQEAIDSWDKVARGFANEAPIRLDWVEGARRFLTLSEDSKGAVLENLKGAEDPEEIFGLGLQAALLAMPEAIPALARAVDGGYAAVDALARHPWTEAIRSAPAFAEVLKRAEVARQHAQEAFREAGGPRLLGL
jgi:hypothetical protein